MRRPDSIIGLTVHLARQRFGARSLQRAALLAGALGTGAVSFAALHHGAPPPVARASVRAAQWSLGRCAQARIACVSDAMCGAGDRCVDPLRLGARVRAITPRDETVSVYPHLAVDGDGYGVVWSAVSQDAADIWFARLDGEGKRRGAPVQLTRGGSLRLRPRLARGARGWAVGWLDVSEDGIASHVLRLDATGAPQGAPVVIGAGDLAVLSDVVAGGGGQYGVAYFSATPARQISVHLARFNQDGAVGAPITVAGNQLVLGMVGLAAINDTFALGWNHFVPRDERAETFVARVAADGSVSTPVRLDAHAGRNGSIALDAPSGQIGAVWEDQFDDSDDTFRNALAFGGVSAAGAALPRKTVTDRRAVNVEPNLVAAGAQHGLVFTRLDDDTPTVQFARLNGDGALLGALTQLNGRASLGALGSVVWNGRTYAAAWTQLDTDGISIRFARLDANGRRVGAEVPISAR